MASSDIDPAYLFGGRYQNAQDTWEVALKPCGESYEVVELNASGASTVAIAADLNSYSTLFTAPRAGADRYSDWADFEWRVRLGSVDSRSTSVWRIAETLNWAAFLGQAVDSGSSDYTLPLAAALWRGWTGRLSKAPAALYWPSDSLSHLWLTAPGALPRYVRLGADVTAEALVFALSRHVEPRTLALDIGPVSADFRKGLTQLFSGRIHRAEPFSEFKIADPLREIIENLENPSMFLPALGAARARAEGAPSVLSICESSPEALADGV